MSDARPDLAARLTETATRVPARDALIWRDPTAGSEGPSRRTSWSELDRRVAAAAGALQGLGVGRGDRVALLLGNTPDFVEAYLGTLRVGATAVPINVASAPPEVAHVLGDSGARVLVAAEATAAIVDDLRAQLGTLEHVVLAGASDAPGTWTDLLADAPPVREVERDPDDLAALVYTSGTTGRPRGAMLTRRNLAANQDQVLDTPLAIEPDDVVMAVLPLFHIYALNVGLGCCVRTGATLVLVDRFDPADSLRLIATHRVTVVLGAPPMYVAWLAADLSGADWSSVRLAVSGAAPLPAAVLERFRDEVGVEIWEGYGLTEAAPAVTSTAVSGAPRPGSVGRPLPGIELRVVGEDGRDVEPGDPGEVWVRGPNVFAGYLGDEASTREVLTSDGWLRTGDVGVLDGAGDLRLVDRSRDLIIVSGFNVYPREVEEVLHRHPAVAEAAVVGVPHPYSGEMVKAHVVRRPGQALTEDEVVAWCARHLARFKCPSQVEFADALPHTATGKVRRGALRRSGGDG